MPFQEYLWLVLCLILYLKYTICSYTDAARITDILLDQRYTSRQKRPMRTGNHNHISSRDSNFPAECCPSVTQSIAPLGGIAKDGRILQLFRDPNTIQKFYERVCAHNVKDRACGFIDHSRWRSKCEQKHTYTYAIVKDFNVTQHYRMDYMRIKSGCSCAILGPAKIEEEEIEDEEQLIVDEITAVLQGNR